MSTRLNGPTTASRPRRRSILALGGGLLLLCALGVAGLAGWRFFNARGAVAGPPVVEYVLDASPRMAEAAEAGSGTRLAVAQGVLNEIIRPSDAGVTAGFRVFGTGKLSEACADTDLLVPLAPASQSKISSSLQVVNTGSSRRPPWPPPWWPRCATCRAQRGCTPWSP